MMVPCVDAGPFLNTTMHNEIKHALKQVHHGVARLIRIPVIDFADMVQKIIEHGYAWQPFQPMLFGLPVDQTTGAFPEIVTVHDDGTNGVVNTQTELEVI